MNLCLISATSLSLVTLCNICLLSANDRPSLPVSYQVGRLRCRNTLSRTVHTAPFLCFFYLLPIYCALGLPLPPSSFYPTRVSSFVVLLLDFQLVHPHPISVIQRAGPLLRVRHTCTSHRVLLGLGHMPGSPVLQSHRLPLHSPHSTFLLDSTTSAIPDPCTSRC